VAKASAAPEPTVSVRKRDDAALALEALSTISHPRPGDDFGATGPHQAARIGYLLGRDLPEIEQRVVELGSQGRPRPRTVAIDWEI